MKASSAQIPLLLGYYSKRQRRGRQESKEWSGVEWSEVKRVNTLCLQHQIVNGGEEEGIGAPSGLGGKKKDPFGASYGTGSLYSTSTSTVYCCPQYSTAILLCGDVTRSGNCLSY